MSALVVSVRQLNMYVKSVLESDGNLRSITVVGELANYKRNSASGHAYFTLKDGDSAVKCVMFNRDSSLLRFVPRDGMKVFVTGRISIYERDGQYQLYAEKMVPDGIGAEFLAFEQLKEKLSAEGLFDEAAKKPIPRTSSKIGVISSLTGAAIHDFCTTVQGRYPFANIFVYGVSVQGAECPSSVIEAIKYFKKTDIDVLVITRGGGSFEDLNGFNNEALAREVFACNIPVVSAIGHETDFTILDFVADLRAATPTAAAQYVTPGMEETKILLEILEQRCKSAVLGKIEDAGNHIASILQAQSPISLIEINQKKLDDLSAKTSVCAQGIISKNYYIMDSLASTINALSPLAVLNRGYGLVYKGEKTVKTINEVSVDDVLKIRVKDGEMNCCVKSKTDL